MKKRRTTPGKPRKFSKPIKRRPAKRPGNRICLQIVISATGELLATMFEIFFLGGGGIA